MDKSEIDNQKIWITVGVGSGLGRIECKKSSWWRFKNRATEPAVDTSVTLAQYLALGTDAKLEKKRAPGNWTAAKYKGKTRKVAEVAGKSCVVLDLDNISHDQLDDIRGGLAEVNAYAWFMHTTRSHTPEKPRARMIIPASRLMSPEESHAVHRLVSLTLADDPDEAIEIPDLVSFRTNQTMFWPSICKDQEFWTDERIAPFLDVDGFLEAHPDWTDHEQLPYQQAEKQRGTVDPGRKMEDPREKPEPIGAFCRAFSVEDVMGTWLPEIYVPGESATETRYTYAPGSGSNGVVIYDGGLFAHSNHATDPIEGSANAFDLLRIHKFGHLDTESHANTSPGNLPSFKEMVKLARSLPEVAAEEFDAHDATLDDIEDDDDDESVSTGRDAPGGESPADRLDDLDDEEPEPDKKKADGWQAGLRRKANGEIDSVAHNIRVICENDPRIARSVAFNEFTQDPVARKRVTSKSLGIRTDPIEDKRKGWRRWTDADDIAIQHICSAPRPQGYEVDFTREKVSGAVFMAGKSRSFHPIRDMLERCHKKYVEGGRATRGLIEQIPQRWLGCPDDEFHRESSRTLMLALVARTYKPGHKFDCVTIIRGDQGGGKGRLWRILSRGYFANLPNNFEKPEKMVEAMRGTLIGELGEMSGLRKETAEVAKDFITRTEDQLRLAYARREDTYPRRGILVGTSNQEKILHDPTGNRRFWIWSDCHSEEDPIDGDDLEAHLDALYGEAVDEYIKMREAQSNRWDDLHLDLRSPVSRRQRDRLADTYRAQTAIEVMTETFEGWLDERRPAHEVMVDADGLTLPGYEGDETPMVRNMVTAGMALDELRMTPAMSAYRNADRRTFGKALGKVPGWSYLGLQRRHDRRERWYARGGEVAYGYKGPLWVPAGDVASDDEADEFEGLLD